MPSRGQANPRRGISEGSRWGWGPSAIEKKSGRKGGKNRKGRMGGRERPRPCRGARPRQGYGGAPPARRGQEASGGGGGPAPGEERGGGGKKKTRAKDAAVLYAGVKKGVARGRTP